MAHNTEKNIPEQQKQSDFQKKVLKNIHDFADRINSANLEQTEKDRLLSMVEIMRNQVSIEKKSFTKDEKSKIQAEIARIGNEIKSAGKKEKTDKNNPDKPNLSTEIIGKKDRQSKQQGLFADLEEARRCLVEKDVLKPHFGTYKKIQADIAALEEVFDKTKFDNSCAEITKKIVDLLNIAEQVEKPVVQVENKELSDTEAVKHNLDVLKAHTALFFHLFNQELPDDLLQEKNVFENQAEQLLQKIQDPSTKSKELGSLFSTFDDNLEKFFEKTNGLALELARSRFEQRYDILKGVIRHFFSGGKTKHQFGEIYKMRDHLAYIINFLKQNKKLKLDRIEQAMKDFADTVDDISQLAGNEFAEELDRQLKGDKPSWETDPVPPAAQKDSGEPQQEKNSPLESERFKRLQIARNDVDKLSVRIDNSDITLEQKQLLSLQLNEVLKVLLQAETAKNINKFENILERAQKIYRNAIKNFKDYSQDTEKTKTEKTVYEKLQNLTTLHFTDEQMARVSQDALASLSHDPFYLASLEIPSYIKKQSDKVQEDEKVKNFASNLEKARKYLLQLTSFTLAPEKNFEDIRSRFYKFIPEFIDFLRKELPVVFPVPDKGAEYIAKLVVDLHTKMLASVESAGAAAMPETAQAEAEKKPSSASAPDAEVIKKRIQDVEDHGKKFSRLLIEVAAKNLGVEAEVEAVREALTAAGKNIHSEAEYESHIKNYEQKLEELISKIDAASKPKDDSSSSWLENIGDKTPVSEEAAYIQNVAQPIPTIPKKGLWARAKEKMAGFGRALFNKETGKAAAKVAYDSVASIIGVKFVTDIGLGWLGIGDRAQYKREKELAEISKKDIDKAVKELFAAFEMQDAGKELDEDKSVEARKASLEKVVNAAKISAEAKEQILEKIEAIYEKHKEGKDKAKAERSEEIRQLLDVYVRTKIEKMKFAKDALNFALTMTGLSAVRGVVYAGTSLLERARKSSREFAKQTVGTDQAGAEIDFKTQAKDVFVKSTIETVRALTFHNENGDTTLTKKAINFVRALGTVARGLGITNLVITGGGNHQNIDRLLDKMEQDGFVSAMGGAAVENIKDSFARFGHMAANPLEGVKKVNKAVGEFVGHNLRGEGDYHISHTMHGLEGGSSAESTDGLVSYPDGSGFAENIDSGVANFAAEHHLSEHSAQYLNQFGSLQTHPESLNRILEASHVGGNIHSHFTGSKPDNLIEVGGERRAVIFEELLKHDKQAAVKFLEDQDFSKQHLSHLVAFADKKGNVDFAKFVEKYNPNDKKMSLALFKAMQGKENTELANAGFVRAATADHVGRTVQVKGGVEYFGLDKNGKPILSGDGQVMVKETILRTGSAAEHNEGLSTDDKLWANANVMRGMRADGTPFEGDTKNVLPEFSPKGIAQFMQGEADKAQFAKMGEEHINALDRPVGRNDVTLTKFNVTHLRDKEGTPIERRTFAEQPAESPVPDNAFKPLKNPQASKGVAGKTVAVYTADKPVERGQVVENRGVRSRLSSEEMVSRSEVVQTEEVNSSSLVETGSETKPAAKVETVPNTLELTEAQRDYVERLNKLFDSLTEDEIVARMSSFNLQNGAEERILDAIANEPAFKNFGRYFESISNNRQPDMSRQSIQEFGDLLNAYARNDQNWYKMIKNDELRLMLDPNADNLPVVANNSHAVRIWDQEKQEELFITNPQYTFVTKGDSLLKMDGDRVVDTWKNYKEAIATARQSSNMNR